MVTRTNGAPADQVNEPVPSILTWLAVVTMDGAFTTNEPK
jgi:hypothetical protein